MAKIKGFAIRGLLRYVKESGFPGGIPAALAELPPSTAEAFQRRILHASWYPYAAYGDLLAVVDRVLGRGDLSLMPEIGRFAARGDAGAGFKVVAFFTSVETLLRRSSLFWERYCDTGSFETTDVQAGSGIGMLKDFPDVAPSHCHLLTGWIDGMARVAGAKTVAVEKTLCVHRGDRWCEYRGTWGR